MFVPKTTDIGRRRAAAGGGGPRKFGGHNANANICYYINTYV